jgi:GABA(A) receptor-associated protein
MDIRMIAEKYPDKVPVVVFNNDEVRKFFVPKQLSLNEFIFFCRQKMQLPSSKAIFVEIDGRDIISFNTVVGDLHTLYKGKDEVLYVRISPEAAMGEI